MLCIADKIGIAKHSGCNIAIAIIDDIFFFTIAIKYGKCISRIRFLHSYYKPCVSDYAGKLKLLPDYSVILINFLVKIIHSFFHFFSRYLGAASNAIYPGHMENAIRSCCKFLEMS